MTTKQQHYQARMQRALDHIDQHLDDSLDLDTLSDVAAFSRFHFHRQFISTFGLTVARYVQLARMKRASYRLAYREAHTVTEIALDAGYEAPDAFARAFRRSFDQSPSAFRKSPDWEAWQTAFGPFHQARSKIMKRDFNAHDVEVRTVDPIAVATMVHHGDPKRIGETIQRFIAWRKATGLNPKTSRTFNIFHSDMRTTAPEDYRMDLCASTDNAIDQKGERIIAGTIPGGRCAVLRVTGHTDDLAAAALFLYRDWLPTSGEEPSDFPLFCERVVFFPEVPEHEAIADLFLPLR